MLSIYVIKIQPTTQSLQLLPIPGHFKNFTVSSIPACIQLTQLLFIITESFTRVA